MSQLHTCTVCESPVNQRLISLVSDGRLWSIPLYLCVKPSCLIERGAQYVLTDFVYQGGKVGTDG